MMHGRNRLSRRQAFELARITGGRAVRVRGYWVVETWGRV